MGRIPDKPLHRTTLAGLTYVEVMVSTVVSAIFISTTLQGYLAATSLRVKTRQVDAAMGAVQTDIERIRQRVLALPSAATDCSLPTAGSYAQQLLGQIVAEDAAALSLIPQETASTPSKRITVRREAAVLQNTTRLPISDQFRNYQIDRTLSVATDRPPAEQVLTLAYVVRTQSEGFQAAPGNSPPSNSFQVEAPIVAQLQTVLLPTAALACF